MLADCSRWDAECAGTAAERDGTKSLYPRRTALACTQLVSTVISRQLLVFNAQPTGTVISRQLLVFNTQLVSTVISRQLLVFNTPAGQYGYLKAVISV